MTDKTPLSTTSAEKAAYGIPIRNVWYMLLYALKELPHSPYWQMVDVEKSPSLDALLASVLVKAIQQRMRIGLGCDYIPEQRLLRGVRGRIHFTKSLKKNAFQHGQAFCEFEQYSINVPKNQIIRSTLLYLANAEQFGPIQTYSEELRHTIRWLVRTLEGIDLIQLTPDFIHRQQVKRHDHDYRVMLAICDLILQRRLPTEKDGQIYASHLERDRLVLHNLYERFVANFFDHHLLNWTVQPQPSFKWHDEADNKYLPVMRPDVVLRDNGSGYMVILDTKFTPHSLKENRWGKEMFDSSHLYQIYAYLRTQEHISDPHRQASGILLYPAVSEELSERIQLQQHQIRIECVNLAAPWQNIEQRLLNLIDEFGST